eukprot:15333989-Ditylum_brightwellii.AAC.1
MASICNAALNCGTKLHIYGKGQLRCYRHGQYAQDKCNTGSHGAKYPKEVDEMNPMFQKGIRK